MTNYLLETAVRENGGRIGLCELCDGDSTKVWTCGVCHQTGLFAPPVLPLTASNRAVIVVRAVYKGTRQGKKSGVEVDEEVESYDLLKAATCCEAFRALWLRGLWNQSVGPFTSDSRKKPAMSVEKLFVPNGNFELSTFKGPVARAGMNLHYCPNCGTAIQIQQQGKRVVVVRIEKVRDTVEYSEPDIVEG